MISEILSRVTSSNDRVLDVGTKHGKTVTGLSGTVVGVDIELDPQVEDVWFCLGDGRCLPFESNSFDYVVCTQVLEHLSDKKKLIEEMSRVSRPSGILYVNFPNRLFPDRPHSPPGWYSYLPRKVAVAVAPYLLNDETAEYYKKSVFNLSPIRARRLLHKNFDSVTYDTFRHKAAAREVFLGHEDAEGYESSRKGRLIIRALPLLRRLVRIPVLGWPVELFYPNSEYTCENPRQS